MTHLVVDLVFSFWAKPEPNSPFTRVDKTNGTAYRRHCLWNPHWQWTWKHFVKFNWCEFPFLPPFCPLTFNLISQRLRIPLLAAPGPSSVWAESASAVSTVCPWFLPRRSWLIAVLFSSQKCQNVSVGNQISQAKLLFCKKGTQVCSGEMQRTQGHTDG